MLGSSSVVLFVFRKTTLLRGVLETITGKEAVTQSCLETGRSMPIAVYLFWRLATGICELHIMLMLKYMPHGPSNGDKQSYCCLAVLEDPCAVELCLRW